MNRLLIALAASLFGFAAMAADKGAAVGGDCCADLEQRVAELEATTARKGNRKVSVTVYGEVDRAFLYTDIAGATSKGFIDNSFDQSRVGFTGAGKLNGDFSAGFRIEVGLDSSNALGVLEANVFIESKAGRVTLGTLQSATRDIAAISTANTLVASKMLTAYPGIIAAPPAFDGGYYSGVRYDTPTLFGAVASASWSRDGVWDGAVRFAKEFEGLQIAAGVGYSENTLLAIKAVSGSVSAKYVPFGLFVNGAAGRDETVLETIYSAQVQGGIERNVTGLGASTAFGEYGRTWSSLKADSNFYGAGFVQAIDAAALDIYVSGRVYQDTDIKSAMVGARIRF